ncbi:hypothetical protein EDD85DRAFT_785302 [Armillaria nabsnona]|nr:hypothetical protein EDD85DRAFT_785302 [Armillaria nabsnona]
MLKFNILVISVELVIGLVISFATHLYQAHDLEPVVNQKGYEYERVSDLRVRTRIGADEEARQNADAAVSTAEEVKLWLPSDILGDKCLFYHHAREAMIALREENTYGEWKKLEKDDVAAIQVQECNAKPIKKLGRSLLSLLLLLEGLSEVEVDADRARVELHLEDSVI